MNLHTQVEWHYAASFASNANGRDFEIIMLMTGHEDTDFRIAHADTLKRGERYNCNPADKMVLEFSILVLGRALSTRTHRETR